MSCRWKIRKWIVLGENSSVKCLVGQMSVGELSQNPIVSQAPSPRDAGLTRRSRLLRSRKAAPTGLRRVERRGRIELQNLTTLHNWLKNDVLIQRAKISRNFQWGKIPPINRITDDKRRDDLGNLKIPEVKSFSLHHLTNNCIIYII